MLMSIFMQTGSETMLSLTGLYFTMTRMISFLKKPGITNPNGRSSFNERSLFSTLVKE